MLVGQVVDQGAAAIERVHLETARRPFAILERIPLLAAPAETVHIIHDAAASTVYAIVRIVNDAAGKTLDAVIDTVAPSSGGSPSPLPRSAAGGDPGARRPPVSGDR
jgi:hypothetical protein